MPRIRYSNRSMIMYHENDVILKRTEARSRAFQASLETVGEFTTLSKQIEIKKLMIADDPDFRNVNRTLHEVRKSARPNEASVGIAPGTDMDATAVNARIVTTVGPKEVGSGHAGLGTDGINTVMSEKARGKMRETGREWRSCDRENDSAVPIQNGTTLRRNDVTRQEDTPSTSTSEILRRLQEAARRVGQEVIRAYKEQCRNGKRHTRPLIGPCGNDMLPILERLYREQGRSGNDLLKEYVLCQTCRTVVRNNPDLIHQHIASHYPKAYFCPVCRQSYGSVDSLVYHLLYLKKACIKKERAKQFGLKADHPEWLVRTICSAYLNVYFLGGMESFEMPDDLFTLLAGRERNTPVGIVCHIVNYEGT
ncbi:uncharacterized protein FOMMEDRAFT_165210 [Fomitiporia mediterranea MF3/22]|uniref:uncharacterized protein n=1 Tax=Fomitiporia mediterranea (strain MF3/22) TaxID=694068 RepID=UPI0004408ABF|nr:uncharacterized protein FOMMEDRAFT_165210 [Fomitiporia mediterranea MF3/22]EJD06392.1 hypothetical protein FOMMEDRAFT_165210 [Fomitiporia mediterranea MF3/22]